MTRREAAQMIACQLGISDAHDVEVEGIDTVESVEPQGDLDGLFKEIRYRLTFEGHTQAAVNSDARMGPSPCPESLDTFRRIFADKPNAKQILKRTQEGGYLQRLRARYLEDMALSLGCGAVMNFRIPGRLNASSIPSVDIDTGLGIAIEGKAQPVCHPVTPVELRQGVRQASRCLAPSSQCKAYWGVVVVYPDGALSQVKDEILILEQANPGLRICEFSELREKLACLRGTHDRSERQGGPRIREREFA